MTVEEGLLVVHKFGGTSVADAACIVRVARILIDSRAPTDRGSTQRTAAVVSAMRGVTDRLIGGARLATQGDSAAYREVVKELRDRHLVAADALLRGEEREAIEATIVAGLERLARFYDSIAVLGELTARGTDAVMCFGEQWSASLLAAVLRREGAPAEALNAAELIVTDDRFGAATPRTAQTRSRLQERVAPLIAEGIIPVITGYVAATEAGVPTTLGRSGSDCTAAIVAAGLDAGEVRIWTDVNGILTADPNIVAEARTLEELSYAEATHLARFGAEVLHPRTIRPIIAGRIPLRIVNSFNPGHPGTRIVPVPRPDRRILPAIISATGLSLVTVAGDDEARRLPVATRALRLLADAAIEVPMLSQSYAEQGLILVVRDQDRSHTLTLLRRGFASDANGGSVPDACHIGTEEEVAIVSVIGVAGWGERGIASHAFAALGKQGVRVIAVTQAAAEDSVSFCIPAERAADTVRFLHRELGLEATPGIGGAAAGTQYKENAS